MAIASFTVQQSACLHAYGRGRPLCYGRNGPTGPDLAGRAGRRRNGEEGKVAAVTPAAQNLAIEAFLGLMVLLLAISLAAIIRMPPITGTTGSAAHDEALGWPTAIPATSPPARSEVRRAPGASPAPAPSTTADPAPDPAPDARPRTRRARYVPRHGQGYVPPEREQGPPWGPADTPPDQLGEWHRPQS